MPTLDIWSNAASTQLRSLLSSALACSLVRSNWTSDRCVYICSPWVSDFPVFDNRYRQFDDLVPEARGKSRIRFSDVIKQIAQGTPVRIISKDTEATRQFLAGALKVARSGATPFSSAGPMLWFRRCSLRGSC